MEAMKWKTKGRSDGPVGTNHHTKVSGLGITLEHCTTILTTHPDPNHGQ